MSEAGSGAAICVGRYGFTTGTGFEERRRTAVIYRVELDARRDGAAEALEAEVSGREVLSRVTLGANHRAAWVRVRAPQSRRRQLVAAAAIPGGALVLRANASDGREGVAEQLVRNVIDAYRPGVLGGFCLGPGAIVSEGSRNERAAVTLASVQGPEIELSVDTQTIAEPRGGHPYADMEALARDLASRGVQLKVLMFEPRTVAGMAGHEGRIALTDAQQDVTLRYLWFHAGSSARFDDPEVSIGASGPVAHRARLDAAWHLMLESFKRLPQGVK